MKNAVKEAVKLYDMINGEGLRLESEKDIITAIQAQHLSLASIEYLKAVVELLKADSGARGWHII